MSPSHSSGWAWLLLLPLMWCGVFTPQAAARSQGDIAAERQARELENLRKTGEAALSRKDLVAAERAFTEYYRRTRRPIGLLNLGLLAHAKGQLLDAHDLLRRFQSDPRVSPELTAEAMAEGQRILTLPRPPCGKVNIIGESGPLVLLDGRLLGTMPLSRPLLVAPGKHTLGIEDGEHHQQAEIDVAIGRYLEITYARSNVALLSVEKPGALLLEQYSGLLGDAEAPLRQTIEDILQSSGLSPLPLGVVLEQLGRPSASSCAEAACQLKLARDSELDYVLSIQLTQRAPNTPWRLRLEFLDVEVGEQAASSEEECAQCDAAQSAALIKKAVPLLITEARRRPRGEIEVKSSPAGAVVRLASRTLGTTPLLQPAWSGSFDVEVTLAGHETQRLPIVIEAGAKATLSVTLVKKVTEPPSPAPPSVVPAPPPRRPAWRLGLGGGALGAGALLVGFGGGALAVDGLCIDSPPNPLAFCDQVYATRGIGAGLTAAGGALILSGVVLLALPPRRSPRPSPISAPLNR